MYDLQGNPITALQDQDIKKEGQLNLRLQSL